MAKIIKQWSFCDSNGDTAMLVLYSNNIAELSIIRGVTLSKHKYGYTGRIDMLEYFFRYHIRSMMLERLNAKEVLRRLVILAD